MNTAAHEKRCSLFTAKEDYLAFRAHWRSLASDPVQRKQLTATAHALCALLRGRSPHSGFSDVRSTVKLANGARPRAALSQALNQLSGRRRQGGWVFSQSALTALALMGPSVSLSQLEALQELIQMERTQAEAADHGR